MSDGEISNFLKSAKFSVTMERMELFRIITGFKGSFGVNEVIFEMKKSGCPISRSTFYRNVSVLKAAGLMEEDRASGCFKRYMVSIPGRNSYRMRFIESGIEKIFHDGVFEKRLKRLCAEYGMRQDGIKVVIEGVGLKRKNI